MQPNTSCVTQIYNSFRVRASVHAWYTRRLANPIVVYFTSILRTLNNLITQFMDSNKLGRLTIHHIHRP